MKCIVTYLLLSALVFTSAGNSYASDKIDIQFQLCGSSTNIKKALQLENSGAESRKVYLFENKDLLLFNHKIEIRLRVESNQSELALKLFNLNSKQISQIETSSLPVKCESDWHGTQLTGACTIKSSPSMNEVKSLLKSPEKLSEILSQDQLLLLSWGSLQKDLLKTLRSLGPIESHLWEWNVDEIDSKISLEECILPKGTTVNEISSKSKNKDARYTRDQLKDLLLKKGLILCADQSGSREMKLRELLGL